jgi:hypothetical protein
MEEYTLTKDISGEGTPSQSICGEVFFPYVIKSSLVVLCNDLKRGKGKQNVYIDEEILIVSPKRSKGHGSIRGRGCQIKKEFVLRDSEEENGNDERVEENDGMKNQVPINVGNL